MILTTLIGLCALCQAPTPQEPAQARPEPMPIPRTTVLSRGERKIVIDGSLQDWPSLPPLILDDVRQVSGTEFGAWRGRSDLAARAFLMWDADALYVALNVLDDWHVKLAKDSPRLSEIPPADDVVVTIDPGRDTRSLGNDLGRADDAEFWLAEVEGQGRLVVRWDRFRGTARYADGAEAVVHRDDDEHVTYYEARLPWAEILPHGTKPAAGLAFGLQLVVSDFDEPTDPLPQTRVGWTFGMGPRIDPGLFGSVMLVDASSEDLGGATVPLPEVPPAPKIAEPPVPGDDYWIGLFDRLRAHGPQIVDADTPDPRFAGGKERLQALSDVDRQCAEFPRVDFLEYQVPHRPAHGARVRGHRRARAAVLLGSRARTDDARPRRLASAGARVPVDAVAAGRVARRQQDGDVRDRSGGSRSRSPAGRPRGLRHADRSQ